MATSGPRLGMQYVDPSPIATHIVSPEAMEGEFNLVPRAFPFAKFNFMVVSKYRKMMIDSRLSECSNRKMLPFLEVTRELL